MAEDSHTEMGIEDEKKLLFDRLYTGALARKGNIIEWEGPYSKKEFLDYVAQNHSVVLHGSNNRGILELEPRQANCKSKKFGNMIGVYATEDNVLPMFHAIKDEEKFNGVAISGCEIVADDQGKTIEKKYQFEIEPEMMAVQPWSEGMVYILPKDTFEQGVDDEGKPIDEWMSKTSVKPAAKLNIKPEDFPYLAEVKTIQE